MIREIRFAGWLLRKASRLMAIPDELLAARFPPSPLGWVEYRALRSPRAAEGGASKAECGGYCGG